MTVPLAGLPTFVAASMVRQANLNALSTGLNNLSLLASGLVVPRSYVPAVGVNTNANQSIANNVDQTVSWNAASVNNDVMWAVGAPDHLTIKSAGMFIFWARAHFVSNATGHRAAHIMVNGTSIIANSIGVTAVSAVGTSADTIFTCITQPTLLPAGATVYLSVYQNSGVALNLLTTLSGTMLAAIRIGQ